MAGEGDAERLVVLLEARIRDFEKNMAKASGTATRDFNKMRQQSRSATRQMEADMMRSTSRINQALASTSTRIGAYGRSMAGSFLGVFAGAAVLRGTTALVDANTRVTNSLKVAGLEGDALKSVYDALFVSAQKNAAPLESLATLYGRVSLVQRELGVSTNDLLKFTDNVSLALRVAGTDAQTASGALLQLSQAMGSGVVRAEEFNSILEGATPIAQAAAAGLKEAGGSVAKLRQLVVDGKISSEAFFAAFQAGSVILEEKVAGAELTTSQALIRLQNVLQDAAGKFNSATGASSSFASTIDSVATSVERLGNSKILSWLGNLNNLLESSGFLQLDSSIKEIEAILSLVDGLVGGLADSFDGLSDSTADAIAVALGFADAASAPAEMRVEIGNLSTSLNTGKTDADKLRAELVRLGAAPLNLGIQIGQIMDLARAAIAASGAVAAIDGGKLAADGIALQRDEQSILRKPSVTVKPVSLDDYDAPTKKGKGAKSARDKEAEELERQEKAVKDLIDRLEFEKSLIGLSAVQQQKLTALREAGAAATEDQRIEIGRLIEETAREQASVDYLAGLYDGLGQAGQDAFMGIVDAMKDGKIEAGELGDILGDLLSMAGQFFLNQGFSALKSAIIPGYAVGTNSAPGGISRINENGGEIVDLPRGARVYPHDVSMAMASAAGASKSDAAPSITFAPNVTMTDGSPASIVRLERAMGKMQAEFEYKVQHIIRGRGKRWFG